MAASAWAIFDRAKYYIGNATINLSATAPFRLSLHQTAASANLVGDITVYASVGSESSGGGYAAATLGAVTWTTGTSAGQMKWDCSDPIFTAISSTLSAVRYAVIWQSASAGGGPLLCYAALSATEFDVSTSNTLTIQMNTNGIFTLT